MLVAACQNCKHSVPAVLDVGDHRCNRIDGYPTIHEMRSDTGLCGKPARLFVLREDLRDPVALAHPSGG
jgi:hypothetical protein